MENAVPNAIHYTKAYTDIVILLELVGNGRSSEARFRVVDHADGVPPEALSRLFEPFASLRHESAKPAEAALGLSIIQRIVLLHSGSITARNREPGGLEMETCLPATGSHPG
jgi:signal transduction histidine kinase